jgi:hypothetical protein
VGNLLVVQHVFTGAVITEANPTDSTPITMLVPATSSPNRRNWQVAFDECGAHETVSPDAHHARNVVHYSQRLS